MAVGGGPWAPHGGAIFQGLGLSEPTGLGVCGDSATTLPYVYVDVQLCGGGGHAGLGACGLGRGVARADDR